LRQSLTGNRVDAGLGGGDDLVAGLAQNGGSLEPIRPVPPSS
jgi:hypothetical protein